MKRFYALLISLFCISIAYSQDFFNTDNRWHVAARMSPSPESFGQLYIQPDLQPTLTTGQLWLQGGEAAAFYTIQLYTLHGQELYRRRMVPGEGFTLPGSMSSGVYAYLISDADGRRLRVGKLVRK